jgi:hypothetical protein
MDNRQWKRADVALFSVRLGVLACRSFGVCNSTCESNKVVQSSFCVEAPTHVHA